MLKVGITGNIGAGKSTISRIFELLGIPVYYADTRAKKLMIEDEDLVQSILSLLGQNAYDSEGTLDRKYIAGIVFQDKSKLASLNKLVHPAVATDFLEWSKNQQSPYILKEAALLFEAESYKLLDYNIMVTAPLEVRINRVVSRDKVSKEEVLRRVNNQWLEEKKCKLADFIITNDGEHSLVKQVLSLHQGFLKKASNCTDEEI